MGFEMDWHFLVEMLLRDVYDFELLGILARNSADVKPFKLKVYHQTGFAFGTNSINYKMANSNG